MRVRFAAVAVTCRLYRDGALADASLDPARVSDVLGTEGALVWLDITAPDEGSITLLREEFRFHELALEDCLHPHQRPKVETYDSTVFIVAYGTSANGGAHALHETAMFVGAGFLVTVRKEPAWDMTPVLRRWGDARAALLREGSGALLYLLLDELVDGYFRVVDLFDDRIDAAEDELLEGPVESGSQRATFLLRKDLVRFRRAVAPLRDALDALTGGSVPVVTPALEPYYRDVYDHVLRASDFIDSARETIATALDAHLSMVSNRLNDVMKRLTSWAAIILVPTLIAGVYGMNFDSMPELRWRYGYAFALGAMAASGLALWRIFRKRDWL